MAGGKGEERRRNSRYKLRLGTNTEITRFPRRAENYLALISRQIIRKRNRTGTGGQIRRMEIRFVEAREAGFPENRYRYRLSLSLSLSFLLDSSSLSRFAYARNCATITPFDSVESCWIHQSEMNSINVDRYSQNEGRDQEYLSKSLFLETLYVNRNQRRFYD